MYRPNRIGPWICGNAETVPWDPGVTLTGVIDDVLWPKIGAGVESVSAPTEFNYQSIFTETRTFTSTQKHAWALGVLVSGVNPEPDNNIMWAIAGDCTIFLGTGDQSSHIGCVIAKLDATPSDPDALITITDYIKLPLLTRLKSATTNLEASINTQVLVGNIDGKTTSQSNLPMFIGWYFKSNIAAGYTVSISASISAHKFLSDVQTIDSQR